MFNSHRVIVWMVALIALPVIFLAPSARAAAGFGAPPTVTVRYDDINLDSPEGVASLYKRIQNAATTVCKPVEGPQSVSRIFWRAWNECYHRGIAKAVSAVHNGNLSAYHDKRSRGWHYDEADAGATVVSR